ncbi:MAG TPA: menaquinone biosynthesis decarboxylase [Egibacteraceae bacterium]|nr:menaquinone biosynthesis decarboxylase [Egibacteraceae bacterium]
MFRSLRDFVGALRDAGELAEISSPVDPILEVTEINDRVVRAGGPALLFTNVIGYPGVPLLINAFGTERRMCLALGVERLDDIGDRIAALLDLSMPQGFGGKLRKLGQVAQLRSLPPDHVRSGDCQQVVQTGDAVDLLRDFPIIQCWPQDGGRFITLPMVISRDPATGRRNVGMYRLQVHGPRTLGMHWQIHKHGTEQMEAAAELGQRIEVAVAIGADPALTYSASAPLPDVDEFVFAGFLRGKGVDLVRAKTVDVDVPADAEIIIEGYVDPAERAVEGPFGDHTGYYTPAEDFPVMHVTAVTHRKRPIYQTIVVGAPPQEDAWLGKASERIFLPLLRFTIPEIIDYDLPIEGVFHGCVIVSIAKRYPKHAQKVMHALWGAGQMSRVKCILVVDADVDVHDYAEVAWRVFGNVDWQRDVTIVEGPVDQLDHASPMPNWGGKIGVDATRKTPAEGYDRGWPPDMTMTDAVVDAVTERWAALGLGIADPGARPAGRRGRA